MERDMMSGFLHVLILAHVARHGPIHGYGLLRAMEESTGRYLWKEGTVYPVLGSMEKDGLLRSRWGNAESGPRRKDYAITAAGRRLLDHARDNWADLRDRLDTILEEEQ